MCLQLKSRFSEHSQNVCLNRILHLNPLNMDLYHPEDLPFWWFIRSYSDVEFFLMPFLRENLLTLSEVCNISFPLKQEGAEAQKTFKMRYFSQRRPAEYERSPLSLKNHEERYHLLRRFVRNLP